MYFKWQAFVGYLHPFVLLETFAFLFAVYAVVTVVANLQVFSWRMLVFPPYALVQAMLMPTVGSIYYVVCARRQGFLGRYRFAHGRRVRAVAAAGVETGLAPRRTGGKVKRHPQEPIRWLRADAGR